MNLPHSAFDFLDVVAGKIAEEGTVHYYDILEQDSLDARVGEIKGRLAELGKPVKGIAVRVVKSYSPTMRYYAMDIEFT